MLKLGKSRNQGCASCSTLPISWYLPSTAPYLPLRAPGIDPIIKITLSHSWEYSPANHHHRSSPNVSPVSLWLCLPSLLSPRRIRSSLDPLHLRIRLELTILQVRRLLLNLHLAVVGRGRTLSEMELRNEIELKVHRQWNFHCYFHLRIHLAFVRL